MKTRPEWSWKLGEALLGHGQRSIQDLAVLVNDDGRVKVMPARGQPRYLEWLYSASSPTGVSRSYIHRYIRTNLFCQTGHRIYVLNEVKSSEGTTDGEDDDE